MDTLQEIVAYINAHQKIGKRSKTTHRKAIGLTSRQVSTFRIRGSYTVRALKKSYDYKFERRENPADGTPYVQRSQIARPCMCTACTDDRHDRCYNDGVGNVITTF